MDNEEINMEKKAKKVKGSFNSDVVVFAFFLLLSFTLWYLNSLSKETEVDMRLPLKFSGIPKGKVLTSDSPTHIYLSLKGSGFSILKLKYPGKRTTVTIDLSKVAYKKVPESKDSEYYILTSGLIKNFNTQLRANCDVVSVKPDTVFIFLAKEDLKPAINGR
jgi:hypothetical protein